MILKAVSKVTPEAFRARLRAVFSVDVTIELAAVEAPILYLRAREDAVVPAAAAELIKKIQPGSKVEVVDAPHCLLQAAPERAAQIISTFVEAIGDLQPTD
jgi:pimeloyl-ACP methyl ester carboxylesterase